MSRAASLRRIPGRPIGPRAGSLAFLAFALVLAPHSAPAQVGGVDLDTIQAALEHVYHADRILAELSAD